MNTDDLPPPSTRGNGSGAMPLRSPLIRHRPWVSDTTWIAHESLTLFTHIAGLLPSRGWWSMGDETGFHPHLDDRRTQPGPNLVDFMAGTFARSVPCVVNEEEYRLHATGEEAMRAAIDTEQTVEVMDPDGGLWRFNQDVTFAATTGMRDYSWRIDTTGPSSETHPTARPEPGATLVLVDRKGRPRFGLVALSVFVVDGDS